MNVEENSSQSFCETKWSDHELSSPHLFLLSENALESLSGPIYKRKAKDAYFLSFVFSNFVFPGYARLNKMGATEAQNSLLA